MGSHSCHLTQNIIPNSYLGLQDLTCCWLPLWRPILPPFPLFALQQLTPGPLAISRTFQAHSYPKASAFEIPPAWSSLPQESHRVPPLLPSGLLANVILLRMLSCLIHRRVFKIHKIVPPDIQNLPKEHLGTCIDLQKILFRASRSTCILPWTLFNFSLTRIDLTFCNLNVNLYLPPTVLYVDVANKNEGSPGNTLNICWVELKCIMSFFPTSTLSPSRTTPNWRDAIYR